MTQPLLLSADGLTLGYQDVTVVEDVRFELARGDVRRRRRGDEQREHFFDGWWFRGSLTTAAPD